MQHWIYRYLYIYIDLQYKIPSASLNYTVLLFNLKDNLSCSTNSENKNGVTHFFFFFFNLQQEYVLQPDGTITPLNNMQNYVLSEKQAGEILAQVPLV